MQTNIFFSLTSLAFLCSRDKNWIESEKMGAFLSVAQGSQEPPLFVEIDYKGGNSQTTENPIGLVGKGITFDR